MVYKIFDPTTGERLLPMFITDDVPVNGSTLAGTARTGALLLNETSGLVYKNTGSKASPIWVDISTILGDDVSVGTITGTDEQDAASASTGAFTTAGGMGVAKRLFVGGMISGISRAAAITAIGTDRDSAVVLVKQFNNLATVTSGSGVLLPSAANGAPIFVWNNGANPVKIYAPGAELIDDVLGAVGVTLTNAKSAIFYPISTSAYLSMMGQKAA